MVNLGRQIGNGLMECDLQIFRAPATLNLTLDRYALQMNTLQSSK